MTTTTPRYALRLATASDLQALMDFYDVNTHQNVLVRQRQIYADAIKAGAVTLLCDEAGSIKGSSISWSHVDHEFVEVGSTRITAQGRGMPFSENLVALQMLHIFFRDPPKDRPVAEVDRPNVHVIKRLTGPVLGFVPWEPCKKLLALKKLTIVANETDDTLYFQCDVAALSTHARYVLATLANPVMTSRDGSQIALDLSSVELLRTHRAEIEALAKMDLAAHPARAATGGAWKAMRDALFPPAPPAAAPARPGAKPSGAAPQP